MFCTLWTGCRRTLEQHDIYDVIEYESTEVLSEKLQRSWEKELEKLKSGGKPSLLSALSRVFLHANLLVGASFIIHEAVRVIILVCFGYLLQYFRTDSYVSSGMAYSYTVVICICQFIMGIFTTIFYFLCERNMVRVRVACSSLVYMKALRIKQISEGADISGKTINLVTNDVGTFDEAMGLIPGAVFAPVSTAVLAYLTWSITGLSFLSGLAVLFMVIPPLLGSGRLFSKMRIKVAGLIDKRLRYINELISGIRIVKMHCWEKAFQNLITEARRRESNQIMKICLLRTVAHAPYTFSGKVMVFVTLLTFIYMNGTVKSDIIFPVIIAFNMLRVSWHLFLPLGYLRAATAKASIRRIQDFLLLEELPGRCTHEKNPETGSLSFDISVRNLTARWSASDATDAISAIDLDVERGKLVLVIGPVGSGKSALLHAILGEMHVEAGSVQVCGKLAYSAQQPWVYSATVRQNIVFGNTYDKTWYDEVIRACALDRDIELLLDGDQTIIGERGVTLSGGQRARISLARAVYHNADVYILDDPCSAVDASVGKHIFRYAIRGLPDKRTRILVTHQLQYLQYADKIVVMNQV